MASVEAFEGFEGFEGFEAFEGQFRATRKKDLARQSPEPTACATPPTVSQSPEPTVWQARGFGASEASRIQKLAALAEPLARFEGFEGFQFRATRKKRFGAPEPRAHSLRNSAHSLAEPSAHSLASARFWSV